MVAHSEAVPRRRRGSQRAVARRFDSAGPFTYVFLILVVMVSLFPLYWSLVVASHSNSAVYDYPPKGRKLLFLLVLATLLVPVQLGLIPLYIEMIHFGWLNSIKAVIAPNLVTAFGVFLMRQYIAGGVPNELIAAARVDGCNSWRVFWHVILPVVRPMAAVLGLLTFMNTWNDFLWPFIVLNARNPTVQVAVSDIATVAYTPDYSLILTGCFISILPLLVVFLFLGRQIVGGIMQGAVKG